MIKSIKVLLYISGITTLLTSIYIFVGMRIGFNGIMPLAIIMFFLSGSAPPFLRFLYFLAIFMFTPILTAADFLCAHYIDKNNVANRIASFRSLITCLLGVFSILVVMFLFKPLNPSAKKIIVEGFLYFIFYGTLLYLLMSVRKKPNNSY